MLLYFVTDPSIGPKDRRLIRSHVMRGKNAGRPRPARTPLKHQTFIAPITDIIQDPKPEELQDLDLRHTLKLDRLFWNELTIASFPEQISAQTRRFVYQHFHTLLAISSSFPSTLPFGSSAPPPFPSLPSTVHAHISAAYTLTNALLSGPDACSDRAIAIVTMLAVFQRIHHQHDVGLVHFGGVRRMIEGRGGLSGVMRESRGVGGKVWRLALEFALQDGTKPVFDVEEVPDTSATIRLAHHYTSYSYQIPDSIPGLERTLYHHHASVHALTQHLNSIPSTPSQTQVPKISPLEYSDIISHQLHRLLSYAPLNPSRPINALDDLVHLVLVAIMTTLMPEYGHLQARYDLLAGLLRSSIRRMGMVTGREGGYEGVLLWAVLVGKVTVLSREKDEDEVCMLELTRNLRMRLKIATWEETEKILCGYGWICVMYHRAGRKWWDRMCS
ncbi:hypothetical protein FB567DRAFT_586834 [Paraphoma chrysanthemicola]|uniref:Transcription factor domain-containing protein n=1 Tax=Paraphoma chrysanthemicola TaxID=798071 RepID=A0A8K0RG60_9PLEO|nr:hypothetical protein FB567DRAFT_586834 [Paraphoma chrysanthemicola]